MEEKAMLAIILIVAIVAVYILVTAPVPEIVIEKPGSEQPETHQATNNRTRYLS